MRRFSKGPWVMQINLQHVSIISDGMPAWKDCWPRTSSEGRIPVCSFRTPESPSMADYDKAGAELLFEQNVANAILICAAPEMFELLKAIHGSTGELPSWIREQSLAIIEKIEGRSKR